MSFFPNVELLNRRASNNVVLRKRPSPQSRTSSNYGRATYSTHSLLTITSSPTSGPGSGVAGVCFECCLSPGSIGLIDSGEAYQGQGIKV
ncbi:hypothetical protein F2Q69_00007879 [Brassica cretica]|uniref:Uncharacterized protein n=1 Tax=Brassica cretica TaxID=69181 RepID=A0A8S9P6T8_BRACR|nr:hypothetical protein F2Q69_00007879 [Brassica cretica]